MKCFSFYLLLFLILLGTVFTKSVYAQFTITESFRGQLGADIKIGDDAVLTSGVSDPVGAGWLRLTTDDQSRKGYAYINRTFPSTLGLLIDFEYKMWRTKDGRSGLNEGGDGFSIYLFDGKTSEQEFALGGYGGSLGYARNHEGTPGVSGLKNGYLGIGFDAFGNFVNKSSPAKFTGSDEKIPNSIAIRGKTTAEDNSTSNAYLTGINIAGSGKGVIKEVPPNAIASSYAANGWENHIDYNKPSGSSSGSYPTARPSDDIFYRRVQIEVTPTTNNLYLIKLRWKREGETAFTELMSYTTTDVPPEILKVGFAASTGWAVNYHEIRNLVVTTPGNLRVSKLANKDFLRTVTEGKANEVIYTIEVNNDTDASLTNVDFKDRITDGAGNLIMRDMFAIDEIEYSGFLPGTSLPRTSSTNEFVGTLNMAAKTIGRIKVKGRLLKVPEGNVLINSATALPTDITDDDLENNTSTVQIPVIAEGVDLVVSKTVDEACLNEIAGNTFTVTVANMGIGSVNYGGTSVSGTGTRQRTYTANRLELSEIVPPGATVMSSTLPDGWELVDSKPNTPIEGYVTYIYQTTFTKPTQGLSINDSKTLESGAALSPFTFKLKGDTSYTNEVQVRLVQERGTLSRTRDRGDWTVFKDSEETSSIEPEENRGNNSAKTSVLLTPGLPQVLKNVLYYCQGESAGPLDAMATNLDYKVVWYSSLGGVALNNVPTPVTTNAGTTRYYVSQTNGSCESDVVEVQVVVLSSPLGGSLLGQLEVCGGVAPNKIVSKEAGAAPDWPVGTRIIYRWEKLSPAADEWIVIDGADGIEYTPIAESTTGVWKYRRVTMPDFEAKTSVCEALSNEVSITVKNCMLISNPMIRSRMK